MSRWFTQCALFFVCRLVPAWALLFAPVAAGAENGAAENAAARPRFVSDGVRLLRQGVAGNMCALTFDDGPSQHTARLLDILKEFRVKATFFVVGTQVRRRPELVRRMLEEGHEVGNHSYSHQTLRRMPVAEQEADLRKLDALLRELGANPRFVRPPYGFYDHNTVNAVQEMDGHLVMWSVDSQDWRRASDQENPAAMQTTYNGAPLRGVFLFHDTHRLTVERMPGILATLAATDCRFVTLSEYIDSPEVQAATQPSARPSPGRTAAPAPVAGGAVAASASPRTPALSGAAPRFAPGASLADVVMGLFLRLRSVSLSSFARQPALSGG